jgi:poly-gamma-glutamate synthesis protein (capsule biosynthesis protein)
MTTRRVHAVAQLVASVALLAAIITLVVQLLMPREPMSSPIRFVDKPGFSSAVPARPPMSTASDVIRLGFVGDIMQHRRQAGDDFRASYAQVAPLLGDFDLAVGNLEFPVDPKRPVGPPPLETRFNGSPKHLDALAWAGFDMLVTANNHANDQGLDGMIATIEQLRQRELSPIGTASSLDELGPTYRRVGGIEVAFQAYTIPPNAYPDATGTTAWPTRDLPLHTLNFYEWQDEYQEYGRRMFRDHVTRARANGAEFVVAYAHWGLEWHMQPTADQRRAAHDMIDSGFDLVVGSHGHVLNGAEIYKGKLIAYSLGNFISDFEPIETRTGAILEVTVGRDKAGKSAVLDFAFYPVVVRREGHIIVPLGGKEGEATPAWRHARQIFGAGLRAYQR